MQLPRQFASGAPGARAAGLSWRDGSPALAAAGAGAGKYYNPAKAALQEGRHPAAAARQARHAA
ncbi:hypothetical protein, partial [Burkholderia glumae]|uniref:hypothetical protein n=1 Tax=Burkholderia glumae TaxID=337 RepID=UPI0020CC0BF9